MLTIPIAAALALSATTTAPRHATLLVARQQPSRSAVRLLFQEEKQEASPTTITRSREAGASRSGSVVVTDGAGSFYDSRTAFQTLYDHSNFAQIIAATDAVADAKKLFISRKARYSGLLDALHFHDQADGLASAFTAGGTWLALRADEEKLDQQISAAAAAGVSRAFILFSSDGPTVFPSDADGLEAKLASSGIDFTVMRTGSLSGAPREGGAGLKIGPVNMPVCDDVPQEDVYRFVTEALSLPEASGRSFSLCPGATLPQLREMRLCGYERRDEVRMLLEGKLTELTATPALEELEPEEAAEVAAEAAAEAAEAEAAREDEVRGLLERARKRGEEMQARLKLEEAEKEAKRRARGTEGRAGAPDPNLSALEAQFAAKAAEPVKAEDGDVKDGDDGKTDDKTKA